MNAKIILLLILGLDALILFYQTSQLSISYKEASLLYGEHSLLSIIVNTSLTIFGHNDFALRLPMIFFHLITALLVYLISKNYILTQRNRVWLVLVFILLPGNVSAAVIVNEAGLLIFGLFLFVYLQNKIPLYFLNILLFGYSFVSIGFAYLFLGLAVYYVHKKNIKSFLYVLMLYAFTSYLYGFEIKGLPSGHFLDTIGVYSAIFTPIIFIYIFYGLHRKYLASDMDITWYLSTTALLISLILSFRQRVALEYFAPYVMLSFPLVAQLFISAYRVRLKSYRTGYKLMFFISFVFLIFNTLIVLFNKELYMFIQNPKKHFAYEVHVAKELSSVLKEHGVECVTTNTEMQKRLHFYGISECPLNSLLEVDVNSIMPSNVTVSYKNRAVYKANVTIINNI